MSLGTVGVGGPYPVEFAARRKRMPRRQPSQRPPPSHQLSWWTARRCWATLRGDSDEYDCRCLEAFRRQIRLHEIPYWGASHQVLFRGRHSNLYIWALFRQLLALDYVPLQVVVPVPCHCHLPHMCGFCLSTGGVQPPFHYIFLERQNRGRLQGEIASCFIANDGSASDASSNDDCWPSLRRLAPGEYWERQGPNPGPSTGVCRRIHNLQEHVADSSSFELSSSGDESSI